MTKTKMTVLALAFVAVGCGKEIDAGKTEAGIRDGLAKRGVTGAKVSCPGGQKAKAGGTFACSIDVNNAKHTVQVTQKDDNGNIEWKLDGLVLDTKVVVADAKSKLAGADITCAHDAVLVKQTDTVTCDVKDKDQAKKLTIKIDAGNVAWEIN